MPRKAKKDERGIGDNSGVVNATALKQYISKIERINADIAASQEDLKCVYDEAKSAGYEAKIIRKVIKQRKVNEQKSIEEQEKFDLYFGACQDLPLFAAAR